MNRPWRSRGIKQITRGLGTLDRELFVAIADSPTPLLDTVMPPLTRAADHSKLWFAIAAGLVATGRPSARRGAARGVASLGVTSLVTNQVAKRIRQRPASRRRFGAAGQASPAPTDIELAAVRALRQRRRIRRRRRPGESAARLRAGVAGRPGRTVAGGHRRALPRRRVRRIRHRRRHRRPRRAARAADRRGHGCRQPNRCGSRPRSGPTAAGVVLVVNPASGSGTGARVVDEVRAELPQAEIVELGPRRRSGAGVAQRRARAEVLAVGGGDGTVSSAAGGGAAKRGYRWRSFPAGTFNHFAKDIGCDTVAKTVDAIRRGSVACVDVVCLNESRMVINTASIGAYPDVRAAPARSSSTRSASRWPGVYAMLHTLRSEQPVRIRYDNKTLQTSLFFLGNSVYLPSGFAPSRRTRMDDGLIDVRILETGRRFSQVADPDRAGLGRLERSPLYHEMRVPEFSFSAVDGPTVIAHDGEVGESIRRGDLHRAVSGAAGLSPASGGLNAIRSWTYGLGDAVTASS